jgi:hypothetical protein
MSGLDLTCGLNAFMPGTLAGFCSIPIPRYYFEYYVSFDITSLLYAPQYLDLDTVDS